MHREKRRVALKRRTRGTEVEIDLRLDGSGRSSIETPFQPLSHLLELLAGHGRMDLKVIQTTNRHSDEGYAIDDLATALAEGLRRAIGDRPRIRQFGSEILPVGDCLVLAAVDLVSPSVFQLAVSFRSRRLDGMDVALIERFLATFADRLGACLHIRMLAGNHDDNKWRAIFLAVGASLARAATEVERDGAREIAIDIDYLEGSAYRPEPAGESAEEAVVEELATPSGADDLAEDEDLQAEGEMSRPARGRVSEDRSGSRERRGGEGRSRGRPPRDRREGRRLPELPDVPDVPEVRRPAEFGEFESLPELSDLERVLPEGADEEGGAGFQDDEGARRRRRGRRGGRGRRRGSERLGEPRESEESLPRESTEEIDAEVGNGRGRLPAAADEGPAAFDAEPRSERPLRDERRSRWRDRDERGRGRGERSVGAGAGERGAVERGSERGAGDRDRDRVREERDRGRDDRPRDREERGRGRDDRPRMPEDRPRMADDRNRERDERWRDADDRGPMREETAPEPEVGARPLELPSHREGAPPPRFGRGRRGRPPRGDGDEERAEAAVEPGAEPQQERPDVVAHAGRSEQVDDPETAGWRGRQGSEDEPEREEGGDDRKVLDFIGKARERAAPKRRRRR
jgi:imidazoleglycerol phosphate dehydratase HisB